MAACRPDVTGYVVSQMLRRLAIIHASAPHPAAGPRPNFYSHEGAPGLVIATGNVGAHLDFQTGVHCNFFSLGCCQHLSNFG